MIETLQYAATQLQYLVAHPWELVLIFAVFYVLFIVPHEAGHACASKLLGYRVRLGWFRTGTGREGQYVPPLHRILILAYGPAANVLTVALFMHGLLAWLGWAFVVWNLWPFFEGSDGNQIVAAFYDLRNPEAALLSRV